ncbi:MAG: 4-hydroxy-tetrahydrodipicolinate reductase [Peptostreptococcaceae bacterium]|nr:4-hydroxy-tetrahydrodipicolinate reductase [Peptostreptococcaceae bacterium]
MKIIITAPKGNMGKLIVRAAAKKPMIEIIGGLASKGRDYIGLDLGVAAGLPNPLGVKVYDDLEEIIKECDMIIDFSTVDCSMKVIDLAIKHNKAFICGTTGFDEEEVKIINAAAKKIPLLKAANTSYVVNVMNKLLSEAAKDLNGMADIAIIDMHSAGKKDAPSGTAKEMASIIEKAAETNDTVSFHSIRAGDIPSSHTVMFGCMGERLEITHHAYNWECYAEGACKAIEYLSSKGPGLYLMEDVVMDK